MNAQDLIDSLPENDRTEELKEFFYPKTELQIADENGKKEKEGI